MFSFFLKKKAAFLSSKFYIKKRKKDIKILAKKKKSGFFFTNWLSLFFVFNLVYMESIKFSWLKRRSSKASSTSATTRCMYCHHTFFNRPTLLRHMERHQAVRERHQCDICQKMYARRDYLKKHKLIIHGFQ